MKREDAAGKERLSITGRLAGNKKRAEPTIRKHGRDIGIGQQRVIASAQFRVANNVECPLQRHSLSVPHTCRSQLQITQLKSHAKLGGRSTVRDM